MSSPQAAENRTKVWICGEELVLKGEESQEYMQLLARKVNSHMERLRAMHPNLVRHRLAVLTAIYLADELEKLRREHDDLLQTLRETR